MSRKSQYSTDEKGAELNELLDSLEHLLDRTKTLYEQYFMGIQKTAPEQLHRDIERKMRELTQEHIRNTALRYRLTTLSQKFGAYNTYWRRTMREIEAGRYIRDIARVQRQAQRRGEDVPEELVAAMPKRMRDRVRRDRELLARRAEHMGDDEAVIQSNAPAMDEGLPGLTRPAPPVQPRQQVHQLDDDLPLDDRLDELFQELTESAERAVSTPSRPEARPAAPARPEPQPGSAWGRPRAPEAAPRRPATSAPAARAQAGRELSSAMPPPPGMTEDETRTLYKRYVKARQLVGDHSEVSYDQLMRTLNDQAPQLMRQYNAKGIQYNVVIKNDRVVLSAKPKRTP